MKTLFKFIRKERQIKEDPHELLKCNCCGKEFKNFELAKFRYIYGYLSKRDMDMLDLKLCVECFDNLTDKLVKECKVNPVLEWTGDSNKPYEIE